MTHLKASPDDDATSTNAQTVPKWIPTSLLALSSLALVAPIIMLRRYKRGRNLLQNQASAPPRRGGGLSLARSELHLETQSSRIPIPIPTRSPAAGAHSAPSPLKTPISIFTPNDSDQFFNAPFYTLKALGIATALVTLAATASIWGVMKTLNAHNMNEFGERMRYTVLTKLPILSYRIYRPAESRGDGGLEQTGDTAIERGVEWNWEEAEKRLSEALDKDGFHGWASAALLEVEAEASVERTKRGFMEGETNSPVIPNLTSK